MIVPNPAVRTRVWLLVGVVVVGVVVVVAVAVAAVVGKQKSVKVAKQSTSQPTSREPSEIALDASAALRMCRMMPGQLSALLDEVGGERNGEGGCTQEAAWDMFYKMLWLGPRTDGMVASQRVSSLLEPGA